MPPQPASALVFQVNTLHRVVLYIEIYTIITTKSKYIETTTAIVQTNQTASVSRVWLFIFFETNRRQKGEKSPLGTCRLEFSLEKKFLGRVFLAVEKK